MISYVAVMVLGSCPSCWMPAVEIKVSEPTLAVCTSGVCENAPVAMVKTRARVSVLVRSSVVTERPRLFGGRVVRRVFSPFRCR